MSAYYDTKGAKRIIMINELRNWLEPAEKPILLENYNRNWFVNDSKGIICVKSKTSFGDSVLRFFIESDKEERNCVNFSHEYDDRKGGSKYSIRYVDRVLSFAELDGLFIKINTGEEYLGRFETENFVFILAPNTSEEWS